VWFLIEIIIVADFYFDTDINPVHLDQYFYINAMTQLK